MISNRFNLALLAAALVGLGASPAFAQDEPPVASPAALEQASGLIASVTNQFDALMEEYGLATPGVELSLTPEMVARSIPSGGSPDDVGFLHMDVSFQVWDESVATGPPENPQDFVLATAPQGCLPSGVGEVVYFRTMALDQAAGHLCVVTAEDGAGVWRLRGRSLAVAGGLHVLLTYDLAVQVDGRPERARALGETAQEGAVEVSTVIADYTLAATAIGRHQPIDDPVEMSRWLGDMLTRMTAVVVTHMPSSTAAPTE